MLNTLTVAAMAACPPTEADGARLARDGLLLAWRPILKGVPVAPAAIPMAQHFAIDIQLCESASVSPAQLTKVDATMPAHRHGMNYRPVITPQGQGRFHVEGLMFHMAGHWQLNFEIRAGQETMRLSQDVQVD